MNHYKVVVDSFTAFVSAEGPEEALAVLNKDFCGEFTDCSVEEHVSLIDSEELKHEYCSTRDNILCEDIECLWDRRDSKGLLAYKD